jgi:hypothetical protein
MPPPGYSLPSISGAGSREATVIYNTRAAVTQRGELFQIDPMDRKSRAVRLGAYTQPRSYGRYGPPKNSAGCNWISGNIRVTMIASAASSTMAIKPKFNSDARSDGLRYPLRNRRGFTGYGTLPVIEDVPTVRQPTTDTRDRGHNSN